MCLFDIFDLCVILDTLHEDFRILFLHYRSTLRNVLIKCIVYPLRIQKNAGLRMKSADCRVYLIIWLYIDPVVRQLFHDLVRKFTPVSIKVCVVFIDQKI